jgi:large subunit ribosomal protein L18
MPLDVGWRKMDRKQKDLKAKRRRVQKGVRRRIHGMPERPRLSVFRSNRHFYCQAVDDENGRTLAAVSSLESALRESLNGARMERAKALGQEMGKRLKGLGIEKAVLDRSWYRYHGCIKTFADAVREEGIAF